MEASAKGRTVHHRAGHEARLFFSGELVGDLVCQLSVAFGRDRTDRIHDCARTGRDQASNDHILLQTFQVIFFSADRCFIEHFGRFLE